MRLPALRPTPITSFRLEAGETLTLRAVAVIHTGDKALIRSFMDAHGERYEHAPLTTLFLARDWFMTRGCEVVVSPDPAARLFTRATTSLRLRLRGFVWKRVGSLIRRAGGLPELRRTRTRNVARRGWRRRGLRDVRTNSERATRPMSALS